VISVFIIGFMESAAKGLSPVVIEGANKEAAFASAFDTSVLCLPFLRLVKK
jgi:hypothetical protein